MTENMDPRPLHRRAMAQTGTIVAAVTPDQFALPTPCTEYDVRALLSHIVGGLTRAALVGEGAATRWPARPGRGRARRRLAGCLPRDRRPGHGRLGRRRQAGHAGRGALGKVPGRFALAGYVQEVLAHGWDLARATGQPTERDPELATWALATAKRILPPDIRGDVGVPFGPVVEVSPDAAPYAQLAAWLGRRP